MLTLEDNANNPFLFVGCVICNKVANDVFVFTA